MDGYNVTVHTIHKIRRYSVASKAKANDAAQSVTIRLPARVLSHFKDKGPGYQTRIRAALEAHIEREKRLASFDRTCLKLQRLPLSDRRALAALSKRPLNTKATRDPFDAVPD
jgi:hypothetical protein